ncbi:MAG TPA: S8 family serine peptidase [Solirubrobacterales bacterium]|nr:S8 family serine peptidase [Solirubrobacterales bacterium]
MIVQAKAGARSALRFSVATLAVACVLMPASAPAAIVPKNADEGLSPQLTRLAQPAVRSQSDAKQAALLGVAADGPGSLLRRGGRVVVNIRFAGGAIAGLADLKEAGGRVLSASRRGQTATVAVWPAALPALARVSGVASVAAVRAPLTRGGCEGGASISEGLGQLKVDQTREIFGLRGAGITVGVLSDSFDTAVEAADESGPVATTALTDVVSNDLPGPAGTCSGQQVSVDVIDEGPNQSSDEGRAMLQIVHDLAPHSALAFATAFESEESFAQNVEELAKPRGAGGPGAEVIVDDVAWFEEPFFQDGPISAAINKVTANGVTYLTAAGNDNLFVGEDEAASWEAPAYRDSGACPAAIEVLPVFNATHCMDFDPGVGVDRTFGITVGAGETLTLDLQWAEPWNGVTTDLDAFVLNSEGGLLTGSVEFNTGKEGTQRPVEIPQWKNTSGTARTVQLAINRFTGAEDPRLKFILLQNGGGVSEVEYAKSSEGDIVGPSIFGHAGAASAISVAAAPFTDSAAPEPYSSRGPVTHYFEPFNGIAPGAPLLPPEIVAKPDLTATDCGATTFFAHFAAGAWRFCGTSAAAPHVAAVAALLRQANPLASTEQIRNSLVETAVPMGVFGPQAVGSGLLDALAAVTSLPEPVEVNDPASTTVPPLIDPPDDPEPPKPEPPLPPPPPPAVAPTTAIKRHPPRIVRTARPSVRVSFRFATDQAEATFLCKLDRSTFQPCAGRTSLVLVPGTHTLKVKARGATGLMDPSPALFRFRVEQKG